MYSDHNPSQGSNRLVRTIPASTNSSPNGDNNSNTAKNMIATNILFQSLQQTRNAINTVKLALTNQISINPNNNPQLNNNNVYDNFARESSSSTNNSSLNETNYSSNGDLLVHDFDENESEENEELDEIDEEDYEEYIDEEQETENALNKYSNFHWDVDQQQVSVDSNQTTSVSEDSNNINNKRQKCFVARPITMSLSAPGTTLNSACNSAATTPRITFPLANLSISGNNPTTNTNNGEIISITTGLTSTTGNVTAISTPTISASTARRRRRRTSTKPLRPRRQSVQLTDTEKWTCPNLCGKFFRNTSTISIKTHKATCTYKPTAQQLYESNERKQAQIQAKLQAKALAVASEKLYSKQASKNNSTCTTRENSDNEDENGGKNKKRRHPRTSISAVSVLSSPLLLPPHILNSTTSTHSIQSSPVTSSFNASTCSSPGINQNNPNFINSAIIINGNNNQQLIMSNMNNNNFNMNMNMNMNNNKVHHPLPTVPMINLNRIVDNNNQMKFIHQGKFQLPETQYIQKIEVFQPKEATISNRNNNNNNNNMILTFNGNPNMTIDNDTLSSIHNRVLSNESINSFTWLNANNNNNNINNTSNESIGRTANGNSSLPKNLVNDKVISALLNEEYFQTSNNNNNNTIQGEMNGNNNSFNSVLSPLPQCNTITVHHTHSNSNSLMDSMMNEQIPQTQDYSPFNCINTNDASEFY